MQDAIAIRRVKTREARQLSEIAFRSKSFWGYSSEFMEACRSELSVSAEDLSNPARSCFLAEAGAEIVGYYALERISRAQVELSALFVEPRCIGRGIGRRLLEHAKSEACRRGATSILIRGDPHTARFYEAAGASRIGYRESESIPGRFLPEYRMSLRECDAD